MTENYIQLPKKGKIQDEYSLQKDRRKAYQIFLYSAIGSVVLTALMYTITLFNFSS